MDKSQDSKNLNDINLLKQQNNLNNSEDILTDTKMETIYFNLLNSTEIIFPKINGFQNFVIFFGYIFNKIKASQNISEIPRKNAILNLLIEELINKVCESETIMDKEKIVQYFYDKNIFEIFLEKMKKNEISLFKKIFSKFSEVSIYYIIIKIFDII